MWSTFYRSARFRDLVVFIANLIFYPSILIVAEICDVFKSPLTKKWEGALSREIDFDTQA